VEMEDGTQRIALGTGAGRWPTTESVMADLLAIHRGFADTESAAIELEECVA
jgi:homoserine dehydrogenase